MNAANEDKKSFESALQELRKYSEMMQQKELTLEEALECYEKGMKCYARCEAILENARQKVEYDTEEEKQ